MGLVSLASAKGSPGVTTAAMLFGALWPRPTLVVEADPSGGDVALRMPGSDGAALDRQLGLSSLVAAGRKSLYPALVDVHAQELVGGQQVLAGLSAPEQARGITQWDELAALFAELPGSDVIADLGRIGSSTPQNVLLERSVSCVLLVDALPSNVVHMRERLRRLKETFGPTSGPSLSVVVVAPAKRSRAVREVAEALERAELEVAGLHHLAHDPAGAGFFLGQVKGDPRRTQLVRSAQPIVDELAERAEAFFVEPPVSGRSEPSAEPDADQETGS